METELDRRHLLPRLINNPADHLFVSGLAGAARDLAAFTGDASNLFALGGVMGAATTIGLGMALCAPETSVVVVTGDGELQMAIGALITVANAAPANLAIICLDNEHHGETGNQPGHTAARTDLAAIARGAGIASTMTVTRTGELDAAARFLAEAPGPRFLVAKIRNTEPSAFRRLMDPAACRYRFKLAYGSRT